MQTVLITGANGFVGYYLTKVFAGNNYKVIATGKGPCRFNLESSYWLYESLDFSDAAAVTAVLQKHRPDIIVHSGALSKPDDCELNKEKAYRTNVTGTAHLLKEASVLKSVFLFLSTDFVFKGTKLNYTEEDLPAPVNYYGYTKVVAEEAVKSYPYDWIIVRTVLVYGHPGPGRQNLLTIVANGLKNGKELKIVADQTRTPTYVEDLVNTIKVIIEKKKRGIFHLSGTDVLTPYEMACAVADYHGFDNKTIQKVTGESFKEPALRPSTTGFDLSKAKHELGYHPISFKDGLKKTFEIDL